MAGVGVAVSDSRAMNPRRAKILGTLGPASSSEEMIGALFDAGLDAVRLNFSHGSHEDHTLVYSRVREQSGIRRKPIAVLGDLQGPKIRVGRIPDPGMELEKGDPLVFLTDLDAPIEPGRVGIDYANLAAEAKVGERVLMDDGALEARITKIVGDEVHTEVVVGVGQEDLDQGRLADGHRSRLGMEYPDPERRAVDGLSERS